MYCIACQFENLTLRMVDAHKAFGGGRRKGRGVGSAAALEEHLVELREQIRKRDNTIEQLQTEMREVHEQARLTSKRVCPSVRFIHSSFLADTVCLLLLCILLFRFLS